MVDKKKFRKMFLRCVSFVLIVSVTVLVAMPYDTSWSQSADSSRNIFLSPQHRIFDSILDKSMGNKGMLEYAALRKLKKDPSILFSGETPTNNLFSKLISAKTVKVFFSGAETLNVPDQLAKKDLVNAFIIPAAVGDESYYIEVFGYEGDKVKTAIHSENEFDAYFAELISEGLIDKANAETLRERLSTAHMKADKEVSFVDATDESVQAAVYFLRQIGASTLAGKLKEKAESRRVLLSKEKVLYEESIVVYTTEDERSRAQSIIETSLAEVGISPSEFDEAFGSFWGLWQAQKSDEFDVDEVSPKLRIVIREAEHNIEEASNEGSLSFRKNAYTDMPEVRGWEIDDCLNTIRDLRTVFKKVVEHDMPEGLRPHYELYKLNRLLDKAVKNERFETAAKLRDQIAIMEKELDVKPEKRDIYNLRYQSIFEVIPGLNPEKILVEHITDGILPTDVIKKDGVVRFNENFIKLMTMMVVDNGINGEMGEIYDYDFPEGRDPVRKGSLGNIYESIMYSVALHSMRGHFSLDENWFLKFNTDELSTQAERGGKNLYTNLLAMMYYWIIIVERHPLPTERAEVFIKKFPHVFNKLTDAEREKLPRHLLKLINDIIVREADPFPFDMMKTGMTKESMEKELNSRYPNSVSNEGIPYNKDILDSEGSWAHAVVDSFLEGKRAKELAKQGKRKIFALEDNWMPEVQKTLIKPLIQELEKMGDASPVIIARIGAAETVEEFALRVEKMRQKEGLDPEDVVVMASASNVTDHLFDNLKIKEKSEEHSALLIGVDGVNLNDNSYVSLLEMITMAMRMSYGQNPISDHPNIKKQAIGGRAFIFTPIPPAKPLEYNQIKDLYDKQLAIIHAA